MNFQYWRFACRFYFCRQSQKQTSGLPKSRQLPNSLFYAKFVIGSGKNTPEYFPDSNCRLQGITLYHFSFYKNSKNDQHVD